MTRSRRQTLSACLRQSIRLIFPFWSGVDRTQHDRICPVTDFKRYSRCSGLMSFLSLASSCEAHFLFTSGSSLSSSSLQCRSSSAVILRSFSAQGWVERMTVIYAFYFNDFTCNVLECSLPLERLCVNQSQQEQLLTFVKFPFSSLKVEPGERK